MQFCIISLLQFIIQLLFQLFFIAIQCLDLDINYSYWVISDLFSDTISFLFLYLSIRNIWFILSNVQILRFNLIIDNYCNWEVPSALISHEVMIYSRVLTCSNVVCLFSCIARPVFHLERWIYSRFEYIMLHS